jgi:hypothetical protein
MLWTVLIKLSTKNKRFDGKINGSEDFKAQEIVSGIKHIDINIHKIPIHCLLKIHGWGEAVHKGNVLCLPTFRTVEATI